jgi:hypothetical protein
MSSETFLRSVFVVYFGVVGSVLVLTPWSPGWHHLLQALPYPGFQLLETPIARASLSGFGLVHLVWAAHDFHQLIRGDEPRCSNDSIRGDGATNSETLGDQ